MLSIRPKRPSRIPISLNRVRLQGRLARQPIISQFVKKSTNGNTGLSLQDFKSKYETPLKEVIKAYHETFKDFSFVFRRSRKKPLSMASAAAFLVCSATLVTLNMLFWQAAPLNLFIAIAVSFWAGANYNRSRTRTANHLFNQLARKFKDTNNGQTTWLRRIHQKCMENKTDAFFQIISDLVNYGFGYLDKHHELTAVEGHDAIKQKTLQNAVLAYLIYMAHSWQIISVTDLSDELLLGDVRMNQVLDRWGTIEIKAIAFGNYQKKSVET